MKLPSLKSMYLLRGTLITLGAWVIISYVTIYLLAGPKGRAMWDYPILMGALWLAGLFIAPIMGSGRCSSGLRCMRYLSSPMTNCPTMSVIPCAPFGRRVHGSRRVQGRWIRFEDVKTVVAFDEFPSMN